MRGIAKVISVTFCTDIMRAIVADLIYCKATLVSANLIKCVQKFRIFTIH